MITELFAKGTVPTEKCTYHTSWGAMLVPEDLRDLDTDDRYFRYKVKEKTEEEGEPSGDDVIISEQGPSKKKTKEEEKPKREN